MSRIPLLPGLVSRAAPAVMAVGVLLLLAGRPVVSAEPAQGAGASPPAEAPREVWFPPPASGAPDAIRWDGSWDAAAAPLPIRGGETPAPKLTTPLRPVADDAFWAQLLNQRRPLLALVGLLGLLAGFFILRWFLHAQPPADPEEPASAAPRPEKRPASLRP